MLENETYLGTKYYNKVRTIREYANPIYGIALDEALRASCERGMGLRPGPANHLAGAIRACAATEVRQSEALPESEAAATSFDARRMRWLRHERLWLP